MYRLQTTKTDEIFQVPLYILWVNLCGSSRGAAHPLHKLLHNTGVNKPKIVAEVTFVLENNSELHQSRLREFPCYKTNVRN